MSNPHGRAGDHASGSIETQAPVPDDHDPLHRLLLSWTDQRSVGGRPDLPVLLHWAPRGSEARLSDYRAAWEGRDLAPVAHVDGRALDDDMRPHEVALLLMWHLSREIPKLGELRFRRFLIGLAATQAPVSTNPAQARRDIKDLINGDNAHPPGWVAPLVATVAASAGIPDKAAELAGNTSTALYGAARRWVTRSSPGVAWYRSGIGKVFRDPYQGLAELSRREAARDPSVDAILCRAFMADIRAAYRNRWRWFARNYNPTLFIDDASRPAVTRFLEHLVDIDGPAPLTVVAATGVRHELPGCPPRDCRPTPLDGASIEDWQAKADTPGWKHRYPTLAGWTRDPEPGGLWIRRWGEPRDAVEVFLDRLACGHPGARARLQEIVEKDPDLDLRGVFLGELGEQLETDVLTWVRGDYASFTERIAVQLALLPDLESVADAPIHRTQAARRSIDRYLGDATSDMWVARSETGVLGMHPLARRALAHRLGRGRVAGLTWTGWHEMLRDQATDPLTTATLYHRLALGEVRAVATELSATLAESPPGEWCRQLFDVTRAPVQATGVQYADAREHRDALVRDGGGTGHTRVPPALVAALQLHTDPLGDPYHELCADIADELDKLANERAPRPKSINDLATQFSDCSTSWNGHRGKRDR
jgi:hypothetical protein